MNSQHTIAKKISCSGIGIHSGKIITLSIIPAPANHGIVFIRSDLTDNNIIPANFRYVVDTRMCTVIGNGAGARIGTIEHLMAALWGYNIDNALIEVSGEEVPIMDGSSQYFIELIKSVGLKKQNVSRKFLEISDKIVIENAGSSISIVPYSNLEIECKIEFADRAIGSQKYNFTEHEDFVQDLSGARTFGFVKDLEYLKKNGLALGASLENAIAIEDGKILNQDGLRYSDEFVRHKVLDCIGDLYLAGVRIKGKISAIKPSHALNYMLLQKIFEHSGASYSVAA